MVRPKRPKGVSASTARSAGLDDGAFPVGLTAVQIDIEQMDLVIAGDDAALGVDQIGPVV